MGKYSLSIFLEAIMASAWKGGRTVSMERTEGSSRSLLFTFAHSEAAKADRSFPSPRAHQSQRSSTFLVTPCFYHGTQSPSSHPIPQRRAPLPAPYELALLHKDTHFFAHTGTVPQDGEAWLLWRSRDSLHTETPQTR